ncbi:DUF927 domain-containing protein [Comamonas sp. J-3]|uniref:DUF927 domain-containing protein n=1 Tax=Comamonas trifloxystrobinivorans TaxID=3350256 RepID=UPI003727EB85
MLVRRKPENPLGTITKLNMPNTNNPIPGETERPRFVVLDDPYQAPDGSKYREGVWFFSVKPGRGDASPTLTQQWVSSPLHVDAITFDSSEGNFGRLLRFRNTLGSWRTWSMPMSMLKSDAADLRGVLLAQGVHIDPGYAGRHLLATYLQSEVPKRKMEAVLQTGWVGGQFNAYALPDCVIGPNASRVVYQSEGFAADEYTQRGTLDTWREGIASLAIGNPVLVLAISAAFAGPVLARVGVESGGIHLIGDSSTGKSTALHAGASVWGGDSFRRSWRATSNGLEGAAAMFNDSLLALDEISECDPRDVGQIVYMVGNGRGKQRASRAGAARPVYRWRTSLLSNGERSIASTMAEAGQRPKAGQSVRLLDIPVQRKFGAWDNLHQHASGPAFSDAIKRSAAKSHGTAGREFLEKLTRDTSDLTARLEELKSHLTANMHTGDGQPARAAARLAVLALAGELATAYGITGWDEGEATKAAAVGLGAWLSMRGDVTGNAESSQIEQAVLDFIDRHGDSRFSDVNGPFDEHRMVMVRDRTGWWNSTSEGIEYWFTTEGMRDALKGFDFHRAVRVMQASGLMAPPGRDGKSAHAKRVQGRNVRVYVVKPEALIASESPK